MTTGVGVFLRSFYQLQLKLCFSLVLITFSCCFPFLLRTNVKWLIWGKKLEMTRSEMKRNSEHALTYSLILTLTLHWICFYAQQWLQKRSNIKEIETWKAVNRLWNGYETKNLETLFCSRSYLLTKFIRKCAKRI